MFIRPTVTKSVVLKLQENTISIVLIDCECRDVYSSCKVNKKQNKKKTTKNRSIRFRSKLPHKVYDLHVYTLMLRIRIIQVIKSVLGNRSVSDTLVCSYL